jgi:putative glycerol-1-phosphate prenyltransferase
MNSLKEILMNGRQKIAILIDPDKTKDPAQIEALTKKINLLQPTFIFVGGSTVQPEDLQACIALLKLNTTIPIILFPGSHDQINDQADGILFLSLISGRNPDFLIGHQVESGHRIKEMNLEVIPTGYVLIDGGKPTAVTYISQTSPIPADQYLIAKRTAIAGEMLGLQSIFLDAGSGAQKTVSPAMIQSVKSAIDIPLIVGGGIRNIEQISQAFDAGADLIVIGNQIESDVDFLLDIKLHLEKDDLVN